MFGLKKFLGKSEEVVVQEAVSPVAAPMPLEPISKGPNGYDPELIEKLKDDHQGLLKYFTGMIKSAEKGSHKHMLAYMARFKKLLQHHLITENTKLYLYLNTTYRHDPDTFALVKSFREEMGKIGRVVNAFVAKWEKEEFNEVNRGIFIKEANKIAGVLIQRINTEEERLYEIYDFSTALAN